MLMVCRFEEDWLMQWPENGPPVLWRTEVGTGYSAVVVVDNRLFTMGNRENRDTVYCLDASSGEEVWKHTYDCPTDANEFEGGLHRLRLYMTETSIR